MVNNSMVLLLKGASKVLCLRVKLPAEAQGYLQMGLEVVIHPKMHTSHILIKMLGSMWPVGEVVCNRMHQYNPARLRVKVKADKVLRAKASMEVIDLLVLLVG